MPTQTPVAAPRMKVYEPKPYVQLQHPEWATSAGHLPGHYTEYLTGKVIDLDASTRLEMKPWGYSVFVK